MTDSATTPKLKPPSNVRRNTRCRQGCPSENARADSDPLAGCCSLNWVS
jgi:hypothetical protein